MPTKRVVRVPKKLQAQRDSRRRMRLMSKYTPSQRVPKLTMKRTFFSFNFSPSTATTTNFWQYQSCTLNQMTTATDITNLFDQYKINAIKYTFRPRYDNFAGNDTVDTVLPGVTNQAGTMIHIVKDPYYIGTPTGVYNTTTLNTFLEQGNVRSYQGNKPFSIYFKPTISSEAGTVTVGKRVRSRWLSTANGTNIQHYGFHMFAQDVNMTGTFGQSWDVFVTYYLSAKGLK